MSPFNAVRLVAGRELGDRLRNRAFLVGTLLPAIVAGLFVLAAGLAGPNGPARYTLGVVGATPGGLVEIAAEQAPLHDLRVEWVSVNIDEVSHLLAEGRLDAALVEGHTLLVDGVGEPRLQQFVIEISRRAALAEAARAAGIDASERRAFDAAIEPVQVVDAVGGSDTSLAGWIMAAGVTIVLFMSVMLNAGTLLTGAVEEKANRVVELLLASLRPWQLLSGKIVAATLLAMLQVGLFVGAVWAANSAVDAFAVPAAATITVLAAVVMIPVGFLFYASLYTVAGSLAASVEDAQSSAGPLGIAVGAAYAVVLFVVLPAPRGTAAQMLSYLPPTAPFTVPGRVALGAAGAGTILLSAAVTLIGGLVVARFAGRLYGASLLAAGRMRWRDAWRAERVR